MLIMKIKSKWKKQDLGNHFTFGDLWILYFESTEWFLNASTICGVDFCPTDDWRWLWWKYKVTMAGTLLLKWNTRVRFEYTQFHSIVKGGNFILLKMNF